MDRLESMRVLLAVVDAGNLSAASRALDMPLATVSRRISELETYLKTKLLNRASRHMTLTEAGQSYAVSSRRLLEELAEVERTASGEYTEPKGELVVTAPPQLGRMLMLPIVVEFLKAYPDISVRVLLVDRVLNMFEDHIDIAIRIGELPDSSLVASHIGMIRPIVCASPSYFARRGIPQTPNDLENHECVVFDGTMNSAFWTFRMEKGEMEHLRVKSRLITNTALSAMTGAVEGLGITQLPSYMIAKEVQANTLQMALTDFEPLSAPVYMVHTGGRRVPLKLRAFLDYVTPRLRNRLAAF